MQLRNYQISAVDSVWDFFRQGNDGNPLIAMPTGTGKSPVIAELVRKCIQSPNPNQKVIITAPSKELVQQNYNTLKRMWPTAPAGIYCAGLDRKETYYPITFGTIDSFLGKGKEFGLVALLLIDEAHKVSPKENGSYKKFIVELAVANPNIKVGGLTATHYRMGQGYLTEGDDRVFTDLVFDATKLKAFNWFFDEGFLCRLSPYPTSTEFDLSKVRITAGEYNLNDLQDAVNKEPLNRACLLEALSKLGDRQHVLVFASGVDHAQALSDMLEEEFDQTSTWVASRGMAGATRDERIADFKAGKYRFMVNNGILTTGFDDPNIDAIVMMRATNSPNLWVQMLGRGTRPVYAEGFDLSTAEGRLMAIANSEKPDCLVLDFAGNVHELGPINDPRIPKPKNKRKPGDAPIKICPSCGMYNHASVRICQNSTCGFEFPKDFGLDRRASDAPLIKESTPKIEVEVLSVGHITYSHHERRKDNQTSLRVSYHCEGFKLIEEFLSPERSQKRFLRWWKARSNVPVPESLSDALQLTDKLKVPTKIHVQKVGKYYEVLNYEFARAEDQAPVSA